jgi:hypothetical protein
LYFEYEFEDEENEVYFAMSKPYTNTMLTKTITTLEQTLPSPRLTILKSFFSISCNIIPVLVLPGDCDSSEHIQI